MQQEYALSVTELNEYVRKLFAGDVLLRSLEVVGEISGYKHHISGHRYFYLKDADSRVQCVMFRQNAMGLTFVPADGMQVRLRASASIFPRDGTYQLYVSSMEKAGIGDLFVKFEQLKKKLSAEGLFDPAIKREIPLVPACIGIATSLTGAAIRDMIRVSRRRNPNIDIVIAPCAVQGAGAADEIVQAVRKLNEDGRANVLLVGRGGGSIEDLWAFNEEKVARAIADSRIPVISCVGHETDFTIADFVADVRAATPSMAAELAVPVVSQLNQSLNAVMRRISAGMLHANQLRRAKLERICAQRFMCAPAEILIEKHRETLQREFERCKTACMEKTEKNRTELEKTAARLAALNPGAVLNRGYAYVTGGEGMITRAAQLTEKQNVQIRFSDGSAAAKIISIDISEKKNEKEAEL